MLYLELPIQPPFCRVVRLYTNFREGAVLNIATDNIQRVLAAEIWGSGA